MKPKAWANLSQPLTSTDRQIAFLLGAIVAGLLLRSVPLDLLPGDAGEFQFAAWNFGPAHATGYPLYLIAGGIWQHLLALVGVTPAYALNAAERALCRRGRWRCSIC